MHALPDRIIGPALTCPITDYVVTPQTPADTYTVRVPQPGTCPPQVPSNHPQYNPDAYGIHTILTIDSDTDSSDDAQDQDPRVQVQVHTTQESGKGPGRVNIKLNLEDAKEFLEQNPDQVVTCQTVTLIPHTI